MSGGEQRVRRIALFGRSHELWPVAALLAQDLPSGIELIVVEDAEPVEPAALTIRLDDPLLARLGIGEDDLRRTKSAIFALGVDLLDWTGDGSRFFLAGSGSLPAIEDIAIHQILLRAARAYDQPERLAYLYQPFRLPARIAEAGKFVFPSGDPRSPLSMVRPTVQMDPDDCAALFRGRIGRNAMQIVQAKPKAQQFARESDRINRVVLDRDIVVEADFYIDVSGALSEALYGHAPQDWQTLADGLVFDRLLSAERPGLPNGAGRPAVARAIVGGLLLTTALRNRTISELIFASGEMTVEAAQKLVGSDAPPRSFDPGYLGHPWQGNLARLGGAAARFGPFLSADRITLHRQAVILADHLPARVDMDVEAREYNRRHRTVAEQIGDYMRLPFVLNQRTDVAWSAMREQPLPESLAIRLDQFRSRGRLVTFEGEIWDEQSWIDLLIGFGVVPERHDPMARSLDMAIMARRLKKLTGAFDQALASLSD